MPGFDRKGPEGKGPMTGRKLGKCTGRDVDDERYNDEERGLGRAYRRGRRGDGRGPAEGRSRGRGRGRGFGRDRGDGYGFRFRGGDQ